MDGFPVPSTTAPQARSQTTNVIESKPYKKYTRATPPTAVSLPPPRSDAADMEDDFPTPRANPSTASSLIPAAASSSADQDWRISANSTGTYIEDDLYDSPSDNDSEVVEFRISNSIRKVIKTSHTSLERTPSLVIPSPGLWPTPQKSADSIPQTLMSPKMPLSPAALARLAVSSARQVPSQSTAPSLDGSLTSEEVSNMSCPSTPDMRNKEEDEREWDLPVQLHPDAMDTLLHISSAYHSIEGDNVEPPSNSDSIEPKPQQMAERGLNISITIPQEKLAVDEAEFSALSIPSPGGFFASLGGASSQIWSFPQYRSEPPSTSIAETFYNVPWKQQALPTLERVVEIDEDLASEGPPTARRITSDAQADSPLERQGPQIPEEEFDEDYERKLRETSIANMSRTSFWLQTQDSYLSVLNAPVTPGQELETPKTPTSSIMTQSPDSASVVSPSKKAVRFSEDQIKSPISNQDGKSEASDSLFYRAFQHFNKKSNSRDAFNHRESRAEAMRTQRHYLSQAHRARLMGSFALVAKPPPRKDSAAIRPVANDDESAKERELVAVAGKEQEALQQIYLPCFDLEADRFLNGGSLLPRPALDLIAKKSRSGQTPRILDLGGQPIASWGWSVAIGNREAKVYTAVPASMGQNADWTAHRGPSNHRTVAVPNMWTLPFPSDSFDVISARTLYSLLRNSTPTRDGGDEYDATLTELYRVLAPGGYMHFSLLDAEVAGASNSSLAARGIEFAVALRARGYDPCAGRRFVARLDKAGFGDVKRSWMSLPFGGADAEGMNAVTGLYGSLAWEKWMLKFQKEMSRPEERLLEGVAKAMDEAKAHPDGAAWRMLVGCARKP